MEDTNPELESFRQQWRQEVIARTKGKAGSRKSLELPKSATVATGPPKPNLPVPATPTQPGEDYKTLVTSQSGGVSNNDTGKTNLDESSTQQEPESALEHYERAVEKESQGRLGDSLKHYRKAYRLDSRVDKVYKDKYYPAVKAPLSPAASDQLAAAANNPQLMAKDELLSITDLINSFSQLSIPPAAPTIPEDPPPPSPISTLPFEVLAEILLHVAILDVSSFARLAEVCKRLAYLVATEDRIWKRVCCGSEVGFGAMHYSWGCDLYGGPAYEDVQTLSEPTSDILPRPPTYLPLPLTPSYPSYKHTFRHRPRIRFNGCYISTVNYARPGASSPTQATWSSTPVLIVTYYRYLRFYRDGSVLSLLTTTEPMDVIPYFSKDSLPSHHPHGTTAAPPTGSGPQGPPSTTTAAPAAITKHVLRGRWRLSGSPTHSMPSSSSSPSSDLKATAAYPSKPEAEGDLYIETEGVDPKYLYKLHLSLRSSAGRAVRNNKLAWRGFWSYNRLTDDWAPFGLRNDKAFVWSRVRSWAEG